MVPYHRPDVRAEHHERQFPPAQVLLILDVLIRCNDDVETGRFRNFQQLAVSKLRRPVHFRDGAHFMIG